MEKLEILKEKLKEVRKERNNELSSLYSTLLGGYESEKGRTGKEGDEVLEKVADKMIKDIKQTLESGGENEELKQEIEHLKEFASETLSDEEHEKLVDEVLNSNGEVVEEIKNGNEKKKGFLVGQVMKGGGKKADANIVKEIIGEKLN